MPGVGIHRVMQECGRCTAAPIDRGSGCSPYLRPASFYTRYLASLTPSPAGMPRCGAIRSVRRAISSGDFQK